MTQQEPTVQVVIRSLTDWIGPLLTGEMCGMRGSAPLKKWLVKPPTPEEEAKLRTGYTVLRMIRNAESIEIARAWAVGMNPLLGDENPLTVIGEGRGEEVIAAARVYLADPMVT